jgi:hypothetical protein
MAGLNGREMSSPPRLLGVGGGHPAIFSRRVHDGLTLGAFGLAALAVALGVAVAVPKPSIALALGAVALLLGVAWLVATPRPELTVTAAAIFLGCINGPLKLIANAGAASSAVQDVVILAVVLGMVVRLVVQRSSARLPPLSGWVFAFILLVLIEAFNPLTNGLLKVLAGYRQQLEWVPFFWFGYMLIRSPERFRRLFLLLGAIASINAVASTAQTQASPNQIASLGAGYNNRVFGATSRKYISEGSAHVRPLGLGSDSGFSGGLGVIALPGTLALLAIATTRRQRVLATIFALGAIAGVATGLGRLQVGGAVLDVFAFAGYSFIAGRRITRPIAALLLVVALAVPLGALFISLVGEGVFSRYTSLAPSKVANTATGYKENDLLAIPKYLAAEPFGYGLATAGAVSGFGGKSKELFEGHNINAETQYNFLVKELGLPGLVIWTGFLLRLIFLAAGGLRRVIDPTVQIGLIGVCSPLVAFFFMAFNGPVSAGVTGGAYYWFAAGVAAYWFLGQGRTFGAQAVKRPDSLLAA